MMLTNDRLGSTPGANLARWATVLAVMLGHVQVAAAQPEPACGVCAGSGLLSCAPCEGKGLRPVTCSRCEGKGRHDCRTCRQRRSARGTGRLSSKKGKLGCPNPACVGGRLRFLSKTRCKVCRGSGTYDCRACDKGLERCACGKKPVLALCNLCAGSGRHACPGCSIQPSSDVCVLCKDERKLRCSQCLMQSRGAPCMACSGNGKSICRTCWGLGHLACTGCSGGGKIYRRDRQSGRRKSQSCTSCKGSGRLRCRPCKQGRVPCKRCTKGRVVSGCGRCSEGKVACEGCRDGRAVGLQKLAEALVDAEAYAMAGRWYEGARQAVQADIARGQKQLENLKAKQREIEQDKDARKRALEARLNQSFVRTLENRIARWRIFLRRLDDEAAEVATWVADP